MTPDERAAWLEERRSGIGASDVAAILGISPWASPFSLWVDKLGLIPDEALDDDDPREFGQRAEAMLAPWFQDRTGLCVIAEQELRRHPDAPWQFATPDAMVSDRPWTPTLGPADWKTDYGKPWDDIPPHYLAQGQWQMHCTETDRMWFGVLHGRRFRVYELDRDDDDIEFMAGRVDEFWERHVLAQAPPEVDGSDATTRALAALYPGGDTGPGEVIEAAPGSDVQRLVDEWTEAKAKAKAAKEEAEHRGNLVRAELGDATDLVIGDRLAASWRPQTRRDLDLKALKAAHPDIVRRFTVETRSRVLRAHNTKETP